MTSASLRSLMSACVAVGVVAMASPVLAQESELAQVVQVRQGLKGALSPSSTWSDVAPFTKIKAGDTLKTTEESAAEILFPTGARLTMGAKTIVRLQDLDGLGGRVMAGRVRLIAPPAGMTYMTAGSLRMSGVDTEAIVERVEGQWRVAVLSGLLQVVDGARVPMKIEAGKVLTWADNLPHVAMLNRTLSQDLQNGFGVESTGDGPRAASSGDARRAGGDPWLATGLSALLPGAGQLYAGEVPRGLMYLGANFACLGLGFYGQFYGQNQLALGATAGLIGLNVIAPLDALLTTSRPPTAPAAP